MSLLGHSIRDKGRVRARKCVKNITIFVIVLFLILACLEGCLLMIVFLGHYRRQISCKDNELTMLITPTLLIQ